MSGVYGQRFKNPLGVRDDGMGGAGANLGIEALSPFTDMVTVVDDFNGIVPTVSFGQATGASTSNHWEDSGWVMTDVGSPTNDEVGMQDPADVDQWYPSCIRIYPGDADDAGGNMQLDYINSRLIMDAAGTNDLSVAVRHFPHLWLPETAAGATTLDNSTWVFACRLGIRADLTTTGSGAWDASTPGGKLFIGYAVAGESAILTPTTGAISVAAAADKLVGFHIPEDGSIDGISQETGTTAYAEGTNFTELLAAGAVAGTVANGATTAGDTMWFDLAFKLDVVDWSGSTSNATTFYHRRVLPTTNPGSTQWNIGGEGVGPWIEHSTKLTNQIPDHTVALVPTIEAINGPTAGTDCVFFLDSWVFGVSRYSRYSR